MVAVAGPFDCIFSYDVFVHFSVWNTYWYLARLPALLSPGGLAIIHHADLSSERGWKRFENDSHSVPGFRATWWSFTPLNEQFMRECGRRLGLSLKCYYADPRYRDAISLFTCGVS